MRYPTPPPRTYDTRPTHYMTNKYYKYVYNPQ
jgi:hypothetical protein